VLFLLRAVFCDVLDRFCDFDELLDLIARLMVGAMDLFGVFDFFLFFFSVFVRVDFFLGAGLSDSVVSFSRSSSSELLRERFGIIRVMFIGFV